jgi:ribosomal protein S18 acetylase RimI-like enzyme
MIKPVNPDSIAKFESLLIDYPGLFDGQFNLDVPDLQLEKEAISDILLSLHAGTSRGWISETNKKVTGLCLYRNLDWDSTHFGLPMERLEYLVSPLDDVLDGLLDVYIRDAKKREIRHISVRIPTTELKIFNSLTKSGFELLGIKSMLRYIPSKRKLMKPVADFKIRNFVPSDKEILQNLVGTSMEMNRFLNDDAIDKTRVPLVYQSWLNEFAASQPENILVAGSSDEVYGFVACTTGLKLYNKSSFGALKPGFIGLIAVNKEYRCKNVGKRLLHCAIKKLTKSGCNAIYANTAMQNIRSMTLFQHEGFVVFSSMAELRITL